MDLLQALVTIAGVYILFLENTVYAVSVSEGRGWTYNHENGTDHWNNLFPSCNGDRQSPINIQTNTTHVDLQLGILRKDYFLGTPRRMYVRNIGFTLQLDIEGGYILDVPSVWNFKYEVTELHFHWTAITYEYGSEHRIDGHPYWGELHIVHHNTLYGGDGANITDGLAVVAVMIEDNLEKNNTAMQRILQPVIDGRIYGHGPRVEIQPFGVHDILPDTIDDYYRYSGSLTTPYCYESVVWTVLPQRIHISKFQARVLQTMLEGNSNLLSGNNFRPPQPVNGRTIYRPYFPVDRPVETPTEPPCVCAGSASVAPAITFIFITTILFVIYVFL